MRIVFISADERRAALGAFRAASLGEILANLLAGCSCLGAETSPCTHSHTLEFTLSLLAICCHGDVYQQQSTSSSPR